jgi:hypothetical protein
MTFDEWENHFKPIKNGIDDGHGFDGCLFETYGEELEFIQKCNELNPEYIWTLSEEDGTMWVGSGYHYVNRIGYFHTQVPWTNEHQDLQVILAELDPEEENEDD